MSDFPADLSFDLGGGPGSSADAYAGMLAALLPPGRLLRLTPTLDDLLAGCALELATVDARAAALVNEADPRTADELLPEHERELALTAAPTIEERRANIVARHVRRQRFKPADFRLALASLLLQDAADVVVIERTPTFCASIGDAREIFRFFIYRDPSLPGTAFLASAQALVDVMQPSHTLGTVIESINFLCDDPHSLCDRDLLGA